MSAPCMWAIDTYCCDGWSELPVELQSRATRFATDVLWALTGRQFGTCPVTVRPCGKTCHNGIGVYWDNGTWYPYIWNGVWMNATCACLGICRCSARCTAWLPGPVAAISEVTVDGVVIPSTSYRVDDDQFLVRQDGECWPECQDFDVAAGQPNTFTVTYYRGTPVPASLLAAGGTLACEYVKACQGSACRLPGRVTSIVRQGMTMTAVDISDLIKHGFTGLVEVDMLIRSFNPYALPARMRLYSPDLPKATVTTIP